MGACQYSLPGTDGSVSLLHNNDYRITFTTIECEKSFCSCFCFIICFALQFKSHFKPSASYLPRLQWSTPYFIALCDNIFIQISLSLSNKSEVVPSCIRGWIRSTVHNSFPGLFFSVFVMSLNPRKPHITSPKTQSFRNPTPENPIQDPNPKTPNHHKWAKVRKNIKNNTGNKSSQQYTSSTKQCETESIEFSPFWKSEDS